MNPFSRSRSGGIDADHFDPRDAFVPDHLPEPGPFLEDHDVLRGEEHLAVHERSRELFEERGVYDATFGYNLAKLNRDRRHPDAGYRYAIDADDPTVLRAEFTPTTPFCPQAAALVKGSFRAWNGLAERHEYDLVRVRVHPMHHGSDALESELDDLERTFVETGRLEEPAEGAGDALDDPGSDGDESGFEAPF